MATHDKFVQICTLLNSNDFAARFPIPASIHLNSPSWPSLYLLAIARRWLAQSGATKNPSTAITTMLQDRRKDQSPGRPPCKSHSRAVIGVDLIFRSPVSQSYTSWSTQGKNSIPCTRWAHSCRFWLDWDQIYVSFALKLSSDAMQLMVLQTIG
jgi:hypothetical protein